MTTTQAGAAVDPAPFDEIETALKNEGPAAAFDRLIALAEARGDGRSLLDALLLKARHDLGLPLIRPGSLVDLPEPTRSQYEERYVEALRTVGRKRLEAGDVVGAWPYYRAIGERQPVAEAIERIDPGAVDGETLGQIMEIALQHGANPRRGFELVLDTYGACSAITAFEHLPPDEGVRAPCADRLTRNIHDHVRHNLRAEIARHGDPEPPADASIPDLIVGRDWLFEDEAYHVDTSHLAAVIRMSPLLTDPATIGLAVELCEYGRRLSPRHRYEGDPPFEDNYPDHARYLRALLGLDADEAVSFFKAKLPPPDPDGMDMASTLPAQMLIRLLDRLGRYEEAIPIAAEHLGAVPDGALLCPGLAALCQSAGRPDLLARHARAGGDLVAYAAAIAADEAARS